TATPHRHYLPSNRVTSATAVGARSPRGEESLHEQGWEAHSSGCEQAQAEASSVPDDALFGSRDLEPREKALRTKTTAHAMRRRGQASFRDSFGKNRGSALAAVPGALHILVAAKAPCGELFLRL